ncbi:MAG: hypothetical protein ACREMB_00390 [Candidatus Rokuibacteriota bacterium]
MRVSRLRTGVVDDPAYPSMPAGAGAARRGVWRVLLMTVGAALAVTAVLVYAPTSAAGGPALGRLAG